jgi:DNA-binding LytR/AlgR family response regulator
MYKIAICDDDTNDLIMIFTALTKLLKEQNIEYNIKKYLNYSGLINSLTDLDYDFILLDIDFNSQTTNGIDIAKKINSINYSTKIIFISNNKDYLLDAYAAKHEYFILKSNLENTLATAVDRVINDNQHEIYFTEKKKKSIHKVALSKIAYLEKDLRILSFIYVDYDKKPYSTNIKFSDLPSSLLEADFVRCHRSYMVNMNYIKDINKLEISMYNNKKLPIGKKFQNQFLLDYSSYLNK